MDTIVTSVRLNNSEQELFGKAAKFYGVSIPKFLKFAARREAENAIDIAIADKAHIEYEKNPTNTVGWDEFADEFLK
jgi:uncharacterized protein (DUF1778 family)